MFFLGLAYLMVYVYPILALILIVDAISMYFQNGHPSAYYRDLEKFALMCIGFVIGFIFFIAIIDNSNAEAVCEMLFIPYFFFVPIFIGKYQRSIRQREYFEPIEKLIF